MNAPVAAPRKPAATKTPPNAVEHVETAADTTPAGVGTALVPGVQNAVALPADLAAELAAEAQDRAAEERPSVSRLSLKGGMLAYQGAAIPGGKMDVVILAAGYWNKFYAGKYNPNQTVNPTCFAISSDPDADMEPHENVDNPVHESCNGCPNMEWGSAGEGSRGKACKETRRLVVIPASALESVESLMKAEFGVVDVPVTSVKNYGNFVNVLAASVKRPMYAVVTTLYTQPDPKTQFKLCFQPVATIDQRELIDAIRSRIPEAKNAATIPYDEAYLQGESADKNAKPTGPTLPTVKTAKFKGE